MKEGMVYLNLAGAIRAFGKTDADVAREIGVTPTTFSRKMRGQCPWKLDEVYDVLAALALSPKVIPALFPPRGKEV